MAAQTTGALTVNNPNTGAGTNVVLNLSTTAATTTGSLSGTIATHAQQRHEHGNDQQRRLGLVAFTVNQTGLGPFRESSPGAGGFTLGSLSTRH